MISSMLVNHNYIFSKSAIMIHEFISITNNDITHDFINSNSS